MEVSRIQVSRESEEWKLRERMIERESETERKRARGREREREERERERDSVYVMYVSCTQ